MKKIFSHPFLVLISLSLVLPFQKYWLSDSIDLKAYRLKSPAQIRKGTVKIISEKNGDTMRIRLATRSRSIRPRPKEEKVEPEKGITPPYTGDGLVITDFDSGLTTNLNSYFSTYEKSPASATLSYFQDPAGFNCLGMVFRHHPDGFCGMWMHLMPEETSDSPHYLDVSPFSCLSFWIKGKNSGEQILLKISDRIRRENDNSLKIGKISDFLPENRITRSWQQAVIPLNELSGSINLSATASLSFQAISGGSTVFLKQLVFCRDPQSFPLASSPSPPIPMNRPVENALWVWNTRFIMEDGDRIHEFLEFLKHQGFTRIFLQVPGTGDWNETLRPLMSRLNGMGIKVYALDGAEHYALKKNHPRVIHVMDKVLRYNHFSKPEERFCGFHWDIEPYQLKSFNTPSQNRLLKSYLEIQTKIAETAHEEGLEAGASIPFWYDSEKNFSRKSNILEELMRILDHAAVMSYRTTAFGPNGTAALVKEEIALAEKYGTEVFVGLETSHIPDEKHFDFEGKPRRGFPEKIPGRNMLFLLKNNSIQAGYFIPPAELPSFKAMVHNQGIKPRQVLFWALESPTRVEGQWLSFNTLGFERFLLVYRQTKQFLQSEPAFSGFAIHYYQTFKEMAGGRNLNSSVSSSSRPSFSISSRHK